MVKRKENSVKFKASILIFFLIGLVLFLITIGDEKSIALIISFLLFVFSVVFLIIGLVKNKKTNSGKRFISAFKLSLGLMFVAFPLIFADSLQQMFFFLSFVFSVAFLFILIKLIVDKIKKKPVKKNLVMMVISLILVVGCFSSSCATVEKWIEEANENHEIAEKKIQIDYDFEVEDGTEPVEFIGYEKILNGVYVYDSAHLEMLYGEKGATANDCLNVIKNNPDIPQKFKPYFIDFVKRISQKYPEASLDTLYHNLKTLKVEELSSMKYVVKSWSNTSLGCYRLDDNAIYIPEGTEYIEGEFGFQVLIHEFCHAARCCWVDGKNVNVSTFNSEKDTNLLEECMNSVFSCSLLNYYEWDIAYQVPSNYLRIMLECMDNYELSDYINYSDAFFLKKLDESTGYTNYAEVMWKLITLQRHDWEDDKIDIPEEEYAPIIDYLCEMYYKKYITEDMTEEEAMKIADDLVYKASYDAPKGFKMDTQRYYDDLKDYCNEMRK